MRKGCVWSCFAAILLLLVAAPAFPMSAEPEISSQSRKTPKYSHCLQIVSFADRTIRLQSRPGEKQDMIVSILPSILPFTGFTERRVRKSNGTTY
jgi:hypothetical protein